jgi:hypothetical protein
MNNSTERETTNVEFPIIALVLGLYLGLQVFGWL